MTVAPDKLNQHYQVKPNTPSTTVLPQRRRASKVWAKGPVVVMVAAILGLFLVGLQARLAVLGYQLEATKQQVAIYENANQRMRLEVAQLKDPQRVADVAVERLGMKYPMMADLQYLAAGPETERVKDHLLTPAADPGRIEQLELSGRINWLEGLAHLAATWVGQVEGGER